MHSSSGSKFRLFQILLRSIVQKRCGRLAASLQMSYWGKITMWRRRWYLPAGTTRIVRKRRCIILTITRSCRSFGGILILELSMLWSHGIRGSFGLAEGEGVRFVRAELVYLMKHKPLLVPSTFLRDGCKFLGYKLGMNYRRLPVSVRRKCSMTKRYWK